MSVKSQFYWSILIWLILTFALGALIEHIGGWLALLFPVWTIAGGLYLARLKCPSCGYPIARSEDWQIHLPPDHCRNCGLTPDALMVMAPQPFPQERDVSRTLETSNSLSNARTGDGRFARGNPGGPGRPLDIDVPAVSTMPDMAGAATRVAHLVMQGEL